jgi:beta-phosphoglucomutase-like phosphatase (HAD superfamily)
VTAASIPAAVQRRFRGRRAPAADAAERARAAVAPTRQPRARDAPTLESIGAAWWSALDAADTAARAAGAALAASEVAALSRRLSGERACTVDLLEEVARDERERASFSNVLVSRSALRSVLGLPSAVTACVFNLDGVLVASAALHTAAWKETLDEFIHARVERTGGHFAPFDPRNEYTLRFHGRPRLDGLRDFLASRGIALPEGEAADLPGAETVNGLANRKKLALLRRLDEEGVGAFEGSRRYLEAARDVGLDRAGVSASTNTARIVESAGLAGLIGEYVDGNIILARGLRARPAPDILVAACDALGVATERAAVFETTVAGVQAAKVAGFRLIVGVATEAESKPLSTAGADLVVAGLAEILDRNVRGLRSGSRVRR